MPIRAWIPVLYGRRFFVFRLFFRISSFVQPRDFRVLIACRDTPSFRASSAFVIGRPPPP